MRLERIFMRKKICVVCKELIEGEDGWLEKHLGISGYSVLYHEKCFILSHIVHLTQRAPDLPKAEQNSEVGNNSASG